MGFNFHILVGTPSAATMVPPPEPDREPPASKLDLHPLIAAHQDKTARLIAELKNAEAEN